MHRGIGRCTILRKAAGLATGTRNDRVSEYRHETGAVSMKPQNNIVTALVTVVVLVVIGFGLYLLLRTFGFLIGGFDSEISRVVLQDRY